MYKGLLLALFLLSFPLVAQAQDPVKVDTHYTVEFENSQVRVLRAKLGPHEKTVMHRHPNAVAIFLTDLNGKFTFPKGAPQETTAKAGSVLWTPATIHAGENTSDQPLELIIVELKSKPAAKKMARKPSTTAANSNTQ